jgi:hypothetical protein
MTLIQTIIFLLVPASWAKSIEDESRAWAFECAKCDHRQSVWDAGGVRWKARGNPKSYRRCVACGKSGWQRLSRSEG